MIIYQSQLFNMLQFGDKAFHIDVKLKINPNLKTSVRQFYCPGTVQKVTDCDLSYYFK